MALITIGEHKIEIPVHVTLLTCERRVRTCKSELSGCMTEGRRFERGRSVAGRAVVGEVPLNVARVRRGRVVR